MDRRSLASLAVPAVPSQTKAMAVDEARRTQAAIVRDCTATSCDPPPYILTELIGKGSFGRVFKATSQKDDTVVAVKIISIEEGDATADSVPSASSTSTITTTTATPSSSVVDTFGDVLKEIRTLQLLGSTGARNINTVLDSLLVGPTVWMVTEYCAGGSVATLMRPTGHLPEKWIVPILREVAEALYWVHGQGIIHRDIKCANVLVADLPDETGLPDTGRGSRVQLCDFGVAGFVETAVDKRRTVTGTLHWMAPELFRSDVAYGTEVDIWAFGSMAYEVATGLPPNATRTGGNFDLSTFGSYLEQNCPRLVGNQYSDGLKELVASCMVHDPTQRPSIEQVQRLRYISGTANSHPTSSLSTLLSAYRLWQARGGGRLSLFSAGGAKGVSETEADTKRVSAWNFEDVEEATTEDDEDDDDSGDSFSLDYEANTLAVYEAYGISLDRSPSLPPTPKPLPPLPPESPPSLPPQSRLRRRPLPDQQKRALPEVPLQGVFDPNTLTSYREKARATYGRRPPPPLVLNPKPPASDLPLRKYLAEPDQESLIDLDLSIVDGQGPGTANKDTIRPGRKDVGSSLAAMRHRTQDWTFPVAASPTQNQVAMAADIRSVLRSNVPRDQAAMASTDSRPTLRPNYPREDQQKRVSILSLIDLDDAFDLGSDEDTNANDDTNDEAPFVFDTPGDLKKSDRSSDGNAKNTGPQMLPPVPMVPTGRVLQGVASREEARNELLRMLSSLGEHLHLATQTLEGLSVKSASGTARVLAPSSASASARPAVVPIFRP